MPQPHTPDALLAKRLIYAMRNGVVADALRQGGSPFRMIMGVNLPQLADIAAQLPASAELAAELWADTDARESMLIAPMLMPLEALTPELARQWAAEAKSTEVADVLCLKLLRRVPWAKELAAELAASPDDMARYTGLRLYFNLVGQFPREALWASQAEANKGCPLTASIARALQQEAQWIIDEQ